MTIPYVSWKPAFSKVVSDFQIWEEVLRSCLPVGVRDGQRCPDPTLKVLGSERGESQGVMIGRFEIKTLRDVVTCDNWEMLSVFYLCSLSLSWFLLKPSRNLKHQVLFCIPDVKCMGPAVHDHSSEYFVQLWFIRESWEFCCLFITSLWTYKLLAEPFLGNSSLSLSPSLSRIHFCTLFPWAYMIWLASLNSWIWACSFWWHLLFFIRFKNNVY